MQWSIRSANENTNQNTAMRLTPLCGNYTQPYRHRSLNGSGLMAVYPTVLVMLPRGGLSEIRSSILIRRLRKMRPPLSSPSLSRIFPGVVRVVGSSCCGDKAFKV